MKCLAEPYLGADPFVFVGYYARDAAQAFPIIERLAMKGIRVWYSDGVDIETVSERLQNSESCLFLCSSAACDEHSFLNRISYAVRFSKSTAFVMLHNFSLSAGLRLQVDLGKQYSIEDREFYSSLLSEKLFKHCLGESSCLLTISEWEKRKEMFWKEYSQPDPISETISGQTILDTVPPAGIIAANTGMFYTITEDETTIGRFVGNAAKKGEILLGCNEAISEHHVLICYRDNHFYLSDLGSKNGTYIDEKQLSINEECLIESRRKFCLTKSKIPFVFVCGQDAKQVSCMTPDEVLLLLNNVLLGKTESSPLDGTVHQENTSMIIPSFGHLQSGSIVEENKGNLEVPESKGDLIDEMTIRVPVYTGHAVDPDQTVHSQANSAALIRVVTSEAFLINQVETVIGRQSSKLHPDIELTGNNEISREHAVIYQYKDEFWLRDCSSLFGTTVNGERLSSEKSTAIHSGDNIVLANEPFFFIAAPSSAEWLQDGQVCILKSLESGEFRALTSGGLLLDRDHAWNDGLLNKRTISRSRKHVLITYDTNAYYIQDLGSTNGTFVNHVKLEKGEQKKIRLTSGDIVSVYDVDFVFLTFPLRKEC